MANYTASVLVEAQLILNERFASPEKRLKATGVLGAFLKNTQLAIPNIGALRTKEERPEKAYMLNRSKRSTSSSRTHNHTGNAGDSSEIAINWQTFSDVCSTSLKRADNNVYSDALILANEIENSLKNIYESVDSAGLTFLGTNKTGVNAASANGTFNSTNDVFEIDEANIARFLQYGKSMLRQNHHKGMADVILDPVLFLEAEHYLMQGASNDVNTAYQRAGLSGLYEAIGLADANYDNGLGYFIPEGTIGVVDWIPKQNRQGYGDYESVLGGYGQITDPRTGMAIAVHGYSERANTAAAGGDTQDVVTQWEFSVDVSFNNTPLSTADETTIFEVGVPTGA